MEQVDEQLQELIYKYYANSNANNFQKVFKETLKQEKKNKSYQYSMKLQSQIEKDGVLENVHYSLLLQSFLHGDLEEGIWILRIPRGYKYADRGSHAVGAVINGVFNGQSYKFEIVGFPYGRSDETVLRLVKEISE